jgi:vancomycin resistance protein VanW
MENNKMIKRRKLFSEISPLTYKISMNKEIFLRNLKDFLSNSKFAKTKQADKMPVLIYKHKSLIRRKLGNVDLELQENKAINLSIASPKVNGIVIKPGEIFSFWKLVGNATEKKGYRRGLTIKQGTASSGIGGGMCQFTNLIHWMILHTPLEIVEHHHHDNIDLFPDFGRQVPFGTGTSIAYNYLDYRFINNTDQSFQIIVYTTEEYLCGEIRTTDELACSYHISCEDEYFSKEQDEVYRNNKIFRSVIDKKTGNELSKELIKLNHAKVMYDTANIVIREDIVKEEIHNG